MSALTERAGIAEILLDDSVLATGSYHLVAETLPGQGAGGHGELPHEILTGARGTIRLDQGERVHRATAARLVRVRLDAEIELLVDVHLYVPAAGFLAFTCSDVTAVERALARQRRSESA